MRRDRRAGSATTAPTGARFLMGRAPRARRGRSDRRGSRQRQESRQRADQDLERLVAPSKAWAPKNADSALYAAVPVARAAPGRGHLRVRGRRVRPDRMAGRTAPEADGCLNRVDAGGGRRHGSHPGRGDAAEQSRQRRVQDGVRQQRVDPVQGHPHRPGEGSRCGQPPGDAADRLRLWWSPSPSLRWSS